jgi:ABC-2 type transport system permease protein
MTSPIWLIAEREFRTYVATLSFWAALAVGPLAAGGGLLLAERAHHPPQPITIAVANHDVNLKHSAEAAVKEAASLDGRQVVLAGAGKKLTVVKPQPDLIELNFEPGFPLSTTARALVERTLERDALRRISQAPLTVHQVSPLSLAQGRPNPAVAARILLMAMLWLTLTGSLGMLLQTVARERATRSLESLLAAAAPWQIMAGKLAGVGGVSLLILTTWVGSAETLALLAPKVAGLAPPVLTELTRPGFLARAAVIYVLAYGFFGSVTVALGALARDSASAQNLSRPMFILLMAAFFVALASAMDSAGAAPSLLLYVPAFTPFLMLVYPTGALSWSMQLSLFALMAIATVLVARFAAGRFALRENSAGLFGANGAQG